MAVSQREKNVVIGGAVLLVGLLFYVYVVSPILDEYSKLGVDLPNKERELREMRDLAAQYDDLVGVKKKLQRQVDSDRKRMILKESLVKAQNALIELLNGFADQAHILVTTQDPISPEEEEPYSEVKVRFDVEGSTQSLREFLQSIEDSSVLLGVEKMRIDSSRDKTKLEVSMEIAALASKPREGESLRQVTAARSSLPSPEKESPRLERPEAPEKGSEPRTGPTVVPTAKVTDAVPPGGRKEMAPERREGPPFLRRPAASGPRPDGQKPFFGRVPGPRDPSRIDRTGPEWAPMRDDANARKFRRKHNPEENGSGHDGP